jgi:hypothetical protein
MKTIKITLILTFQIMLLFFIKDLPVNAEAGRQDQDYLRPPFSLKIVVDGNEIGNETPDCNGCSRIWSNLAFIILSEGLPFDIASEGTVLTSYSAPDTLNINNDENQFGFSGTYQAGKLNGSFTFNQVHQMLAEHYGPQSYEGGGEIVTITPITWDGGGGTLSGWFEYTEWVEKDKAETQRFEFDFAWKAVHDCPCGCDYPDSQARFESITGAVEVSCDPDEFDWDRATPRTVLYVEQHVATRQNSNATIRFGDMNTWVLKEETEIVIKSPPALKTKLELVIGKMWINVKKILKDGSMEIETSQAVTGIKGTTFVLEHRDDQTILKVISGTVSFTSKANGKNVDVQPGEQVVANSQGLSEVTKFDLASERAAWQETTDPETLTPSDAVIQVEAETAASDQTEDTAGKNNNSGPDGVCGSVALVLIGGVMVRWHQKKPGSS